MLKPFSPTIPCYFCMRVIISSGPVTVPNGFRSACNHTQVDGSPGGFQIRVHDVLVARG
jgi:hypothetical protein